MKRLHFDSCTSTNDMLKKEHGDLLVAVAEEQTAGRGQRGNSWYSEAGCNLLFSVLTEPQGVQASEAFILSQAMALAIARTLQERLPQKQVRIKWPNDLVCGNRKICGILLEMSADPDAIEYVVVGIGLNVKRGAIPPGLEAQAACLEDLCEALPPRRDILRAYLEAMEAWMGRLEAGGWQAVAADYRAMSRTLGQVVRVIGAQNFTGTAVDIDSHGALIVTDAESGENRTVYSGDVSVRGLMGYA
jgi:BirA family biotin operon repressor/biotin-[acetyl-CoA-carboxylase] ligase